MNPELLTAHLDDELDPAERRAVEEALADSAELRAEYATLEATRALVRGLPQVEPRQPLVRPAAVPEPGRRTGRIGMMVAGVAAVWLVILTIGVSIGSLPIVPEVDQLTVQHASASETDMPMPFVPMDADDMMADDPAIMADIGHGMGLEAVYQLDDLVQSRYSDGIHAVSVFHEPGDVDWDDLPSGGTMEMMPDGQIWRMQMGDLDVLVTERGDLVVTIVADGDMDDDMAVMASSMVPTVDTDDSLWGRLKLAPGNILDRL
jgi:hypothetical protein